jgi:hypothetical protein
MKVLLKAEKQARVDENIFFAITKINLEIA